MVRVPLTTEQLAAGQRLGAMLREARGDTGLAVIATAAGISPETLRKIEAGRMPSPGFGTVTRLCLALEIEIDSAAQIWLGQDSAQPDTALSA